MIFLFSIKYIVNVKEKQIKEAIKVGSNKNVVLLNSYLIGSVEVNQYVQNLNSPGNS